MALIGTIRKNSWILVITLGLALAAFVLMDLFSNQAQGISSSEMTIGEVNGEKIDYKQFADMENALYSGSGTDLFMRRNYIWNFFLDKKLVEQEANQIGLIVTKEELDDLQFGTNPSPIIRTRFSNETGQVDYEQLQRLKQQISSGQFTDPSARKYWMYQEKEIISTRLEEKLANLVSKGIYSPEWQVEEFNKEQNIRSDFEFVRIPFNTIPENEVNISDAEINSYAKKYSAKYIRKIEERSSEYVSVNIVPTSLDSTKIREEVLDYMSKMETAENDTTFFTNNRGRLSNGYEFADAIDPLYSEKLFDASIGDVVGPIESNSEVLAIKVIDRKMIPDSVHSRHILFQVNNQADVQIGFAKADSLKALIESGQEKFEDLARENSDGPTGPQGGDLGYAFPGQMVPEFNNILFNKGEVGKLYTVLTQFGVHLIEILDKKYETNQEGILYGTISKPFIPSAKTQDDAITKAQNLLVEYNTIELLKAAVQDIPEFRIGTAQPVNENSFSYSSFGGGNTSRQIVQWLFKKDTKEGNLSPEVYKLQDSDLFYTKTIVLVGLKEILTKGMPTVDQLRSEIEPILVNKKKGEKIIDKLGEVTTLESLATANNTTVEVATGAAFNNDIVNGVGNEPAVIAASNILEIDEVSKPIIGNAGVYVIKVIDKLDDLSSVNLVDIKSSTEKQLKNQTQAALVSALKESSKIIDNRSTYY